MESISTDSAQASQSDVNKTFMTASYRRTVLTSHDVVQTDRVTNSDFFR